MRLYAFEGYEAHVLEHESAVERIETLRDQYRTGETELSLHTVDALNRWIVGHTQRADRALGGFLRDVGGAAP
jgi:hemerythrin